MNTDHEASVPLLKIIFVCFVAALGGFLFGFDSGVINGTVDALRISFQSDSVGTGFNVSSMLLGCAVGAFFAGTLADRFGRRAVMLIAAFTFIVSAWGSGIAAGSAEFVFYRVLGGLAVGAASVLCPAYISEIAPSKIRGSLATLQQLMIVIGLFVAFFSNYLIANAAGGASADFWGDHSAWRWMFWIEMIPATLFFLCLLIIPESPRFLVARGKNEKALDVLRNYGHPHDAETKLADIEGTLQDRSRPTLKDLVIRRDGQKATIRPIVWVGLGLASLQQLIGINVVFYYGAVLWQAAGFSEADALMTNVISGVINVVSTFIAIALVDRIGRKPLLLVGSIGMAITLAILAIVFSSGDISEETGNLILSSSAGKVALVAANLYVMCFAFSWGPIMWVMLGEMFPNRIRGTALAVCGLAQWSTNFLITMSFPILLTTIGLGSSYGIYAFFGVVAFFFVRRFVRETKGLTLEQMQS